MSVRVDIARRLGDFALEVRFEIGGGLTALFGPSGAGKSSVLNAIAGLLKPDRGVIEVSARTLYDSARGIDLAPEARRIGYVFQDGRLFPHMSVQRNLLYGFHRRPKLERWIELAPVVELLDIGRLLARKPGTLSGGEQQRVAIGRALLAQPQALLMDEPFASLDQARRQEILPYVDAPARSLRGSHSLCVARFGGGHAARQHHRSHERGTRLEDRLREPESAAGQTT